MYAQITAPGSASAIATAGPTLYAPGNALDFSSVHNGHGLVVNAQLRDAPGDAGQIVAYGVSNPFDLEPGKSVTVDVALQLHPVVALPSTPAAIQVLDASGNVIAPQADGTISVGGADVTLLLTAGTGAVGARLSNLPALPEGSPATVDVPKLTPDPAANAPSGLLSFRYANWNLDAGLPKPCASPEVCQRQVFVFFTDVNGVPSATANATLFVNLLPATLISAEAMPAVAGVGETFTIIATPNEQLAKTPAIHVYASSDTTMATDLSAQIVFAYHLESAYTFTHQVTATDPNGSYLITFTLTDLVGNITTYGVASNELIPFFINSSVPVVTMGTITPSPARAGVIVSIPFTLSQTLPFTSLSVLLGAQDITGNCVSTDDMSWSCSYVPAIDRDTEGTQAILVTATGSTGNIGTGRAVVTLDFTPPTLALPPIVSYMAPPGSVLGSLGVTPTGATVGSAIDVSFTTSELLSSAPVVVSDPAGLTFQQSVPTVTAAPPVSTAFVVDAVLAPGGAPPDGATGLVFTLTDLAGNIGVITAQTSPVTVPSLSIATVIPAAPNTAAGGPISYTRIPWGSSATNGLPSYALSGQAQAAPAGSLLVTYDGPATTSGLIGHGSVAADGSFGPIALVQADRPVAYLTTVDGAGNQSPVVASHNVAWTAAFNGKRAGSSVANPHVARVDSADLLGVSSLGAGSGESTYAGPLTPGAVEAPELPSYSSLFAGSATPLLTAFKGAPWVEPPATAPDGHSQHALAYDAARGVTVLFGGKVNGAPVNDTWEWDGQSWTLKTPPVSPSPRLSPAMVYDAARGVTLLFGGTSSLPVNDTWEWDGTTWTELFPATSPPARSGHAMAYDAARSSTVLFGGLALGGDLGDTWEWDGANWTELSPANSPSARAYPALAFDAARGVTVLFGGGQYQSLSMVTPLNDTWEWNGVTWTSRSPSASPPARAQHVMAYDSARAGTLLFGGTSNNGTALLGDTWRWDGTSWTQLAPPSPAPAARDQGALVYDSARSVAVLCGGNSAGDTWEWNGAAWISRDPPVSPPARTFPALDYDSARGVGVLFAGAGTSILDDTWEWNGTSWAQRSPALSPPARYLHALAYDTARGVSVLFGGTNEVSLNDTWEWNGTSWRQAAPAQSPSARTQHAMAYDAARGVTVLFGGTNNVNLDDTWQWDGTAWTEASPTTSPPARFGHAMAYDSARDVTVLFSGETSTGANDTWEWNGSNWVQRFPLVSPPARIQHSLAYDSARGVTILFGGCCGSNGGNLNDAWEWDGTNWNERAPAVTPPARESFAMAYDSLRSEAFLFGGLAVGDTWLLPDETAARPTDRLAFDFGATGETFSTAAIQQIAVKATAGGTGALTPNHVSTGTPVPGTALACWDVTAGGSWRGLATNAADSSAPAALSYSSSSAWEISRDLFSGDQTIDLAVLPVEATGNGAAAGALALADPELTVGYQHSESPCAVDSTSTCLCASDETVCGQDGGFFCSDVNADPQNCGGCAGEPDGGAVCAGGTWCINGVCGCPGSEVVCEGVCTDTTQDPLNCQTCGQACGAYRSCVAGSCSACQAGATLIGSECSLDLAVRSSLKQAASSGLVQLTIPSTVQVGDQLIVVATPADNGSFTAAVSSGSGETWNVIGIGNEAGQYLAVYEKTAHAGDLNQTLSVSMNELVTGAAESLQAALIAVYSQSRASISVDASAFAGSLSAASAVDSGIATAGQAPPLAATGPNELVLIAAAQAGSFTATLPSGVTALTQSAGLVTGSYAVALPGPLPAQRFSSGGSAATWEIAQIALSSSAR